jgi:hypothetical protein
MAKQGSVGAEVAGEEEVVEEVVVAEEAAAGEGVHPGRPRTALS